MFIPHLREFLTAYGYLAVLVIVGGENIGVPLPGETILIAAAIYAGTTHQLHLPGVILAAFAGAFAGGTAAFLIGRSGGHRLLVRYGSVLHIDAKALRLGHYLFERYGALIVFLGRFVALLRALVGWLAGINEMDVRRFMLFNALGSFLWAGTFGLGGYLLGERLERQSQRGAIIVGIAAIIGVVAGYRFIRHNYARLQAEADRAAEHSASTDVGAAFRRPDHTPK